MRAIAGELILGDECTNGCTGNIHVTTRKGRYGFYEQGGYGGKKFVTSTYGIFVCSESHRKQPFDN